MIKGSVRRNYTLEEILQRSSEYDILRRYIGHDFKLGVPVESPFRNDPTPSFSITDRGGFLYFKDFGDDGCEGNIVEFLKRIFPGKGYSDIINQVAEDMGTKHLIHVEKRGVKTKTERGPSIIQVVKKKFDTADLEYWRQYHITQRELDENNVYAVKRYNVNGTPVPLPVTELCFGYLFHGDDEDFFWKIYRPYAREKKDKWRYSGPNDHMYGMSNILSSSNVVITKSLKDYMVLKKMVNGVCGVQSEQSNSINEKNLKVMEGKQVYVNFDNDEAGRRAIEGMKNKYGFSEFRVPDRWYPIKDFADLAKQEGMIHVEVALKNAQII